MQTQPDSQLQLFDSPTRYNRALHISFSVVLGYRTGELLCGSDLPAAWLVDEPDEATCPECRSRARFLGLIA